MYERLSCKKCIKMQITSCWCINLRCFCCCCCCILTSSLDDIDLDFSYNLFVCSFVWLLFSHGLTQVRLLFTDLILLSCYMHKKLRFAKFVLLSVYTYSVSSSLTIIWRKTSCSRRTRRLCKREDITLRIKLRECNIICN